MFPLSYILGKIKVDQKIYRMATYHLLLVVEEIFDGRLELVETNRHGLGLSAISVSKGIFDFRMQAKHVIENRSRSRAEVRNIERMKKYSGGERENSSINF
jgi:hypothetical protein